MIMFSATFSTVNPRLLHEDLISRKKTVYMKNAEERAGFEIFWRKSWVFMFSLSKQTKTTEKYANYLLCGFLRNWRCPDFSGFDQIWDKNLPDLYFHFFRPSLNGFSRFFSLKSFKIKSQLNNVAIPMIFKRQEHKIFKQTCGTCKSYF